MKEKKEYYISYGTGLNQLPLIQAGKSLGYHIIGVDQNINSEGMNLCDIKIEESILNFKHVYRKLLEISVDFKIMGGFSASYGDAIASWSYVAEKLHLHGIKRPLVEILLDKFATRSTLKNLNQKNSEKEKKLFEQPEFLSFGSRIILQEIEEALTYPIILKPRNGHTKKNIFMIENKNQLRKIMSKKFLKDKNIDPRNMTAENFIPGNEVTVVGFIQDFQFHLIFLSTKLTSPYPPFVEIEHSFPSILRHLRNEIEAIHQKIVDTLQISCSPITSEWKYYNNKFHLIEIAPQIPGEQIGNFLIPRSLQYSYFINLVKLTTGQKIDLPNWEKIDKQNQVFKVKYWVEKPDPAVWETWKQKAEFCTIVNNEPRFPPQDNSDRYGVIGLVL